MKKALLMGVSGAALMFAVSAQASDGVVAQSQGFTAVNLQGEAQSQKADADAGKGVAVADGGDAGSSSHSSRWGHKSKGGGGGDGGDAFAKGTGGDAYASSKQKQGQLQAVSGHQTQIVKLPDYVNTPTGGSGGAAGPGASTGDGGNAIGDDSDRNSQQSPILKEAHDAAQATFRSRAAADIDGTAILGDNVNYDSFNTTMKNETHMHAENKIDDINVSSGDSKGGYAKGGDLDQTVKADNTNFGKTGEAKTYVKDVEGGKGGSGGDGKALSANVSLQSAKSYNKSEGGDGKAYSKAYSDADADANAKAGSLAGAANFGKNSNKTSAFAVGSGSKHHSRHHSGGGSPSADASGKAGQWQDADAWSSAFAKPTATAKANSDSAALGVGGAGGDIRSKTGNSADQTAKSAASGGNGGNGGAANVLAAARSGDLSQDASSHQKAAAATGATQGGNGGNISVAFGTGAIGGIGIGTMSGIANIAQNTGLTANQFSSFSINAHTN